MRDASPGRNGAGGLAAGFLLLVVSTFALIVLGALVRAHEAGLACPDWPLCFGQVVPEMDLKVAFEWSHRALAGSVALGFAGLVLASWRRGHLRGPVRGWALAAAVLLAVQILLGALTVWQLLAAWTVTAHLITGNTFNACLLVLALELRGSAAPRRVPPVSARGRSALGIVAVLFLVQMILGGLVSSTYAGLACPQWPVCSGESWFPTWRGTVGLHLAHRWNAIAVLASIGAAAFACRGVARLRGITAFAAVLALVQVAVGISNVVLGLPVEVTGLHSALAAVLFLTLAAALHEAFRRPRAAAPAGSC